MEKKPNIQTKSTPPERQTQTQLPREANGDPVGHNPKLKGEDIMNGETTTQITSTQSGNQDRANRIRNLVTYGYRLAPSNPETGEPAVPTWSEFLTRDPTETEIEEMVQSESHGTGVVLAWDLVCMVFRKDDDAVRELIDDVFGQSLESLTIYQGDRHEMVFFLIKGCSFYRKVFRYQSGKDEGDTALELLGPGNFVPIPMLGKGAYPTSEVWHSGQWTLEMLMTDDMLDFSEAKLDSLCEDLEKLGYDCDDTPLPDRLFGDPAELSTLALQRVDQWFPDLGLPETRQIAPHHWSAVEKLGLSSADRIDEVHPGHIEVSRYGMRLEGKPEFDVIKLVAVVLGCSIQRAERWLRNRLGLGLEEDSDTLVHDRILAHLDVVGVETRYNVRWRRQELRGGFAGEYWQRRNDHHLAKIQMELPGPMVARGVVDQALKALRVGREVDPFLDYSDPLPEWDDQRRIEQIATLLFDGCCPPDYATAVIQSFLFSVMRMAHRPGHVQGFMPVLIGGEKAARTVLLKELCPEPSMFTNSISFTERGPKPLDSMVGKLIAEVDLHPFKGSAAVTLDAVILSDTAHPRMPDAGGPDDLPTYCGVFGSANDFKSLNADLTGNPNLWPIPVEARKSAFEVRDWVRKNRHQIWAEIKEGRASEMSFTDMPAKMFAMRDALAKHLLKGSDMLEWKIDREVPILKPGDKFTGKGMLRKLGVETTRSNEMRVAERLTKKHGFPEAKQEQFDGGRPMTWTVPAKS